MAAPYMVSTFLPNAPVAGLAGLAGTVTYPSGGTPVAWVFTSSYLDQRMGPAAVVYYLADAINTALAATGVTVAGSLLTKGSTGARLAFTAAVDLVLPYSLASYLNMDESYSNESTIDSNGPLCHGFWPELPLTDYDVFYVHHRSFWPGDDAREPVAEVIGSNAHFEGTINYSRADVEQLRLWLGQAIAGVPFLLYLDGDEATAWAEDNRAGYLVLVLDADEATETWLMEPAAYLGQLPIRALQVEL